MKVLVTNDDGVGSPGLHALARALVDAGHDVVVVAPDRDYSGSGAAIGHLHADDHIDVAPVELPGLSGVPAYAVDGPPGLCVLTARLGGFGDPPDVVVSGINPGCNTGRAVLHSGTVGAALTGANFGVRGLAVSIDVVSRLAHEQTGGRTVEAAGADDVDTEAPRLPDDAPNGDAPVIELVEAPEDTPAPGEEPVQEPDVGAPEHWDTAATVAVAALGWLVDAPKATVLNLNVPDVPLGKLAGARSATLAPFGTVRSTVVETAEDGGRLQVEMRPTTDELPPECDTALVAAGFVAVSAISGIRIDEALDVTGTLAHVDARLDGTP